MSIKVKLYMSYLAMAVVPLILLTLFMLILIFAAGNQDLREITDAKRNESFNQAMIYGELLYVLREQPERLDEVAYLSEMQRKLSEQWAGMLLIKAGAVQTVSPFLQELSPNANWQGIVDESKEVLFLDLFRFQSERVPFQYADGAEGLVVIYYRSEPVPIFWHPLTLAAGLLFVCLTSLLLTYFVSRSIIRPIRALRSAVLRIKDGDLSDELPSPRSKFGKQRKQNEIAQLAAAFEDMRVRLKQSIDQSLQYEENRKLLLSHISHDLKTPISAIKGYVEGIMDGIANTDEKRSRYMETIYRKASDMDQLIDELFLFSKLDLHKVAYDFKRVDMNRYMKHLAEEQRFDLEKSGVRLIYEQQTQEPLIVAADPDKLYRVFINMLDNSVKYMLHNDEGRERQVRLSIGRERQAAIITIEDNGPGIDPQDLPYIFEGFYRAEQSRNSESGGSGLGLAIVQQMISGHGGEVWAENKQDGGARFCIRLPLAADAESEGGEDT
ncbi:HAMP domain-containing sensor histidine kinase [Paenibacillus sp. PL2-23]|uniref:sensor histidine kinase n=1 Tax=Paenibacillus sp. PL2-23 TaxID=2100729 RepID=UPI0030F7812A